MADTKKFVIDEVRLFNRFYTKLLGVLDRHLLDSTYSLMEARLLFELYHQHQVSASQLIATLDIDKGYLSKVIKRFEQKGLITKQVAAEDARISYLSLTEEGNRIFKMLDDSANNQIANLIKRLDAQDQATLMEYMKGIMGLLSKSRPTS